MLVVEHHMDLVRAVSSRVLALVSGAVAIEGPTDAVLESAEFRATMTGDTSLFDLPDRKVATPDA
jgi:ABC-type branched-subunit amino acid transport system ATPase component